MNTGLLILRLLLGVLLVGHGSQKLFGLFAGPGIAGAGKFFQSIGFRPGKSMAIIAGISEATHAQAQAADGVVKNMEDILRITRQTTDGTMQTAASVGQIAGLATELKASVSSFKV